MKLIKILQEFEITATGGMAIYFLLCILYVTIVGVLTGGVYIYKFIRWWLG